MVAVESGPRGICTVGVNAMFLEVNFEVEPTEL